MAFANVSNCGKFVVIGELHLDREVFEALARWAARRGIRVQDAIQLAVCAFNERNGARTGVAPPNGLNVAPERAL